MKEEKGSLNIEKQEAKRDIYNIGYQKAEVIYNIAGDLVIQHPITHELIYFPTIQSVLRKGETIDGDFFKKEPEWVDYEQGFNVERKEVDEIIKKLENNKVQLVLGAPASGKSIILKNVGYKLAKENKKVYVVELKKHPQDEVKLFFENIPKIDDDSPIFIIDDAHLNISECERLIRNFRGRGKGKLIIGSRETKEIIEGEDPTTFSEFEHLSKTALHVQAEDVTEEMIKMFLKTQFHFDEDRIVTASNNLRKYKKDLWYLSWALKVFDSDDYSVDENKIYRHIKKRIENMNADNIFLPLSVFFRYEIPIERKFLEKQMCIKESLIEDLIGLQEIIETEELRKPAMLSLQHSSIADLYFRTYQNYPSFGEKIKGKIINQEGGGELEFCSFYIYMTKIDPRNAVDVVISLERDIFNFKGGLTLLKSLIKEENIQRSLLIGIDKEEDIYKVGKFAYNIPDANEEVLLKLLETININALSLKIAKEEDIIKIGFCVFGIARARNSCMTSRRTSFFALKEMTLKLLESIDLNTLSSKINKEEDIEKVGRCISNISEASEEVALKLADRIDINVLSSKIAKEKDIFKVGNFVEDISFASVEVALKLLEGIDFNVLSSKINKEVDKVKVVWFVNYISRTSEEVALKLLETIDMKSLSSRINREEDTDKVAITYEKMKYEINQNKKLREKLQEKGIIL